jgi:outer membrane protein assembly factor BamB
MENRFGTMKFRVVSDGMTEVVGSMNKFIYAIEGTRETLYGCSKPVEKCGLLHHIMIFIGSDDGFLYCLDIDGKLIWKTKLNGNV